MSPIPRPVRPGQQAKPARSFDQEDVALVALRIAAIRLAAAHGESAADVQAELIRTAISEVSLGRPADTRRFLEFVRGSIPREINVCN